VMNVSLRNIGFGKGLFLSFLLGFGVRLIPEVLSHPYVIGFDTVYYAWRIESGVVWYHWSQVFSTWLLYGILISVYNVVQGDPFLLLKLMAPLLFGLNACGIYYFATKGLNWTIKMGLFASLFFCFQMAALRISWDLYRNVLGLGLLLFALPWIRNGVESLREFLFFALLSVLVVLSHEYGAVALFASVLGVALSDFLKGAKKGALKVLMAVSPAVALFLARVYLVVFPASYVVESNVISMYQTVGRYRGPFFFLTNYLAVHDAVQYYPTYLDLALHVFLLFALLYLVVLPLVLVGFFRDELLDSWSVLLLIGAFGALVMPFFALDLWNRWMLMLVYPFTFYAVNGVARVLCSGCQVVGSDFHLLRWMRLSKRVVKPVLVVSFSLGLVFMVTPLFFGRVGVLGFLTTFSYVPSTMQCNSVPLVDVDDTIKVMQWLDVQMDGGSVLLAQNAFVWWAKLYLGSQHTLVCFISDVKGAVDVAVEYGFSRLYFVWWNEPIGWYGLMVPGDFSRVFSSGRISVFEFSG